MKIKILQQNIINEVNYPTKGSELSAGIDVYSPIDFILFNGETLRIPLGIAIEIEKDEVAIMSERSSMGKKGITSIGNIIDADYRGEISIILQNNNELHQSFKKNDRIGQIVVCKLGDNSINLVNELSDTERGEVGFGSTGK
jgi:dUTP pyrophosphatase